MQNTMNGDVALMLRSHSEQFEVCVDHYTFSKLSAKQFRVSHSNSVSATSRCREVFFVRLTSEEIENYACRHEKEIFHGNRDANKRKVIGVINVSARRSIKSALFSLIFHNASLPFESSKVKP